MSSHRDLGFSRRHTTNTKPLLSWCYSYCIRIVPTEPQSVQYPHPSPVPPHPVRVYATPPPLPHPHTKPRARVRVRMSGSTHSVRVSQRLLSTPNPPNLPFWECRVWACARRVRFRVSGSFFRVQHEHNQKHEHDYKLSTHEHARKHEP